MPNCFPKVCSWFKFPLEMCKSALFSASLPAMTVSWPYNCCQTARGKVICCYFILHFHDFWWVWITFHICGPRGFPLLGIASLLSLPIFLLLIARLSLFKYFNIIDIGIRWPLYLNAFFPKLLPVYCLCLWYLFSFKTILWSQICLFFICRFWIFILC